MVRIRNEVVIMITRMIEGWLHMYIDGAIYTEV